MYKKSAGSLVNKGLKFYYSHFLTQLISNYSPFPLFFNNQTNIADAIVWVLIEFFKITTF